MRISQGLESIHHPPPPCSVAIGVFDGVHLGHQALIRNTVADARAAGREVVVLTFDRHPAELIAPEKVPGYLTCPSERTRLIEALGVDHLVIARFDERFRDLSPESFLRFVVTGVLGAQSVFVGHDFRFGCDQAGDTQYLLDAQDRLGFRLEVLNPITIDGNRVSSSRIRELIRAGELKRAVEMLGHPFILSGEVVEGARLGRVLGYPTANLQTQPNQVVPADGIYAGSVQYRNESIPAAISIGFRPTISGDGVRAVEAYLIGFSGDLYGQTLDVEFIDRLRDELKFESLEALTDQIGRDVEETLRISYC